MVAVLVAALVVSHHKLLAGGGSTICLIPAGGLGRLVGVITATNERHKRWLLQNARIAHLLPLKL